MYGLRPHLRLDILGMYLQALDEVKVREVALVELQKRIGEGEGRLKQQQALYEAVRADRNMYSKSLIEAQVGVGCAGGIGAKCRST